MEILLTGRNGFLGQEIHRFFASAEICSVVRTTPNNPLERHTQADLTKEAPPLRKGVDLVIHAAGKAHVIPQTPEEKRVFYEENVSISANLLSALSRLAKKPTYFVFISSVAVYGLASGTAISETAPLLATDPYGRSKITSEELISSWCKENNVCLTILRLPLIAGENPPGNLGDMKRAIEKNRFPVIGDGKAKRSMILNADIPQFIDKIKSVGGVYNLTDGTDPSFSELANVLKKTNGGNLLSIPLPFARVMAFVGDIISKITSKEFAFTSRKLQKMTHDLTFSNAKAVSTVDWQPTSVLQYYKSLR